MKEAISRYHTTMGVRQRSVKLADLRSDTSGVHVTENGQSAGVYLNKRTFNQSQQQIIRQKRAAYSSGWATETNKPIAHTVTHELAHATWNSALSSPKAVAAGREISRLFNQWKGDARKSGYGQYARTNIDEFWAETVTKAVHGKADYYTRRVKAIAKKYNL